MNRKYRKTVIAGNWKMNQLVSGVKPFMEELKENLPKSRSCDVVLCTPAVMIPTMKKPSESMRMRSSGMDSLKNPRESRKARTRRSPIPMVMP